MRNKIIIFIFIAFYSCKIATDRYFKKWEKETNEIINIPKDSLNDIETAIYEIAESEYYSFYKAYQNILPSLKYVIT